VNPFLVRQCKIIKHHGGTITVESALGKGSTFYVTLSLTGCAGYKGHSFKKSLSDNDDYALPFKHRLCEQMS
jgi:hypothetical protein